MENEPLFPDGCDDVWELVRFCAQEAQLLRSFIEYLKTHSDPPVIKQAKLDEWKKEVGLQFGNPNLQNDLSFAIQRIRDAPPEMRRAAIQLVLSIAHSKYFDESSS